MTGLHWAVFLLGVSSCMVQVTLTSTINTVSFSPPVLMGETNWGPTMFASVSQKQLAVQVTGGLAMSSDGGNSFSAPVKAPGIASNLVSAQAQASATPRVLHGFGTVTDKHTTGNYTSFVSNSTTFFFAGVQFPNGAAAGTDTPVSFETNNTHISFAELPVPARCGKFACVLRLQGCGSVRLADGRMLQTAIVWWGEPGSGGNEKSPQATSVVCFVSKDYDGGGYEWEYLSTVATASDYPWSQEGPNEHDITLLPDGKTVLAIVRMDGGDGPETHPFVDYHYTKSVDGGLTWSPLTAMTGIGCVRPRLLLLPCGALLLSGGRAQNQGTNAPLLWVDTSGTGEQFVEYAITYYHNVGESNTTMHFTAGVNTTKSRRESSCYTALLAVADNAALVTYDLMLPSSERHRQDFNESRARAAGATNLAFAMRVTIGQ